MNWDLTYLFKTKEEFEASLAGFSSYIEKLASYEGKLDNEESFKEFFLLQKEFDGIAGRTYQYASLSSDLNKKDVQNNATLAKVMSAFHVFSEKLSFMEPEILAIGKEKVMGFIDNNAELTEFKFSMEKLFRSNEHVLDAKSEKLLSYYSPVTGKGRELYSSLAVGDGKSEQVKLKNKQVVNVTQGSWTGLIEKSECDADRKKVFEAIYKRYDENKHTYATIYETVLSADKARAKARNYSTILESYLFNNNIPTAVYTNLVKTASTKNKALKKYIKLRQKYLGLKRYHTYDRFMQFAKSNREYSYEDARNIFFDAIKELPEEFQNYAHMAIEPGFVDVYEKDGKRTGAYSSSVNDSRPFILLNFDNNLDDVFTLAHEAGHSIHSLYAMNNQPASLQDYTIFVAEIASTFNEHLLLDYFIKSGNATKEEKIMLLQKAIDEIVGTFYRQTLFADYELRAHKLVEENQPINHEVLSNIMIDLYKQYYGLDIKKEVYKQYVWAYIPHLFYTPFYVYQYATSFSASLKLYKNVKDGIPGAFDRYTNLLKSGGSKYPVEQAREAGVDFTKLDAFTAVVDRMNELVDQLEELLAE